MVKKFESMLKLVLKRDSELCENCGYYETDLKFPGFPSKGWCKECKRVGHSKKRCRWNTGLDKTRHQIDDLHISWYIIIAIPVKGKGCISRAVFLYVIQKHQARE